MKLLILLMSMTFASTPVSAQVITGGVMVGPQFKLIGVSEKIKSFEKHLVKKHKWCPSAGIKLQKADLMDSYLKLALYRSTRATDASCDEANLYLKCMNDETTKELVKELKDSKTAQVFLMSKYGISHARVMQILNFFSKLDKKIE